MKKALFLSLLILPLLLGCVTEGVPSHVKDGLSDCDSDHPAQLDCIASRNSGGNVSELKSSKDAIPVLGLALSGGGSKASPFAMGVIKRFIDEGWLYRTDYLTSVSGGSYAAFYLYYRAYRSVLDEVPPSDAYPGLTRYFLDTRNLNQRADVPPYVKFYSPDAVARSKDAAKSTQNWNSLAEYPYGCTRLEPEPQNAGAPLIYPKETIWYQVHQDAYQGWVECYQDLLRQHRAQLSKYKNGFYEEIGYDN
jgi:hypothetical protein